MAKKFQRKKKWLKLKPFNPDKKILPIVKRNILANSVSDDFEQARREWVPGDIIEENDERYVDHCMICNQPGLMTNYEIINAGTGSSLKVGSTCIGGFIIFQGMESQEESNAFFERNINKIIGYKELKALLPAVLDFRPEYKYVVEFIDASKFVLGTLDRGRQVPGVWQEYIKMLLGNSPEEWKVERIKQILWDPKKVDIKKENKKLQDTNFQDGHWANLVKVKGSRVKTTLRKSKEDNPG